MRPSLRSFTLACALFASSLSSAGAAPLRVFAASSLTEAFREIAAVHRKTSPGQEVEFQFAGSQILRTQIEEGAPADVVATADRIHVDALVGKGLAGSYVIFAKNRLVVVTPRADPKVRSLADLARPGIRIVIADGNVPVGRYTTQVLGKITRAGIYGDDFQKRVTANLVSQETNVRGVLAKVAMDEVDAGFVYATDARTTADKTIAIRIPDRVNVIAEYPIATLTESAAQDVAAQFVALVVGEEGQAILAKHGFEPAR